MSKKDIIRIVKEDKWMMDILRAVDELNLPDWWIGAGFVRGKVWDYLHKYSKRTPLPDIDVIYFDITDSNENEEANFSTKVEENYQKALRKVFPHVAWSVTNQARMHKMRNRAPYKNSEKALSEWSETATCIGVKIVHGKLKLVAPYGIYDLTNLILRPIPEYNEKYKHDPTAFNRRIKEKKWLEKWPNLKLWKNKD